ncbi:hypothetical protein [Nocardia huaxiensis]|uniref:Uncharacterized protein n=1 Tax=Nocardia huaxiensis TaxID=2755382 RepID=A0A7D6VHT3_9NOCA|nr:hypothetical protein [Nocardia huaxiensis]QLY33197.1 hypothetical protein H0264_14040 [Nocardia huaxiensis]UFS99876.1 hypothetical protein LPY97_19345 [Nocardia huaxiensis]
MRTFVHLLLFACAIGMAVGVFGPLVGSVDARDVRFSDLREGFDTGLSLGQVGGQSASIVMSLAVLLLGVAGVILIAALTGARAIGWLGVLGGLALFGVLIWRLDERFGDQLRDDYRDLLTGAWGLYLFGGGLVLALLLLLVPRERQAAPVPVPR